MGANVRVTDGDKLRSTRPEISTYNLILGSFTNGLGSTCQNVIGYPNKYMNRTGLRIPALQLAELEEGGLVLGALYTP